MNEVDSILNPTIFLGAFEFREPVTSLTDFLTALTCWFGFFYLVRNRENATLHYKAYRNYFLLFAISMTSAAWLGHAFQAYLSPKWKMIGWLFSLTAQLFLAFGSLNQIKGLIANWRFTAISMLLVVQFIIFVGLILFPATSDFKVPQIGTALVLAFFILPMQALYYWKLRNAGSLIMVLAILYGLIPSYIYNNQISFHRWFNYHDISHVLMSFFMLMMIFASRKLALTLADQPK